MPTKPSARALAAFDQSFGKRFGESAIRKKRAYKVVSTGSLSLDAAMGCGGYIVGRITEIWGPESVGKTTLSMIGAANFQRDYPDRLVGWIDMERTFDWDWAEANGLDTGRIRLIRPRDSEEVSDMTRRMVESGLFSVTVLDSVGGMVTNEEMKLDAQKSSVGTAAKVITRMVKQAAVLGDETGTSLLVINQVRANISPFGADTDTGGGFALKHASTHKIRLRRTTTAPYTIGSGDDVVQVGVELAAIVEKNKVAPPRRTATFALFNQYTPQYGPRGIDRAMEAYQIGRRLGIIEEPKSSFYLLPGDDKPIHGEPKTIKRLRENPEILDKIRKDLLARIADHVADEVPEEEPESSGGTVDFSDGAAGFEPDQRLIDQIRADEARPVEREQ
jgi:recombination protein RecA